MRHKIGINLNCYGDLPVERQIALMQKEGFEACFTGSELTELQQVAPALKAAGVAWETIHAPYAGINDIWLPGEQGDRMLQRLTEALQRCVRFGVPALVVHLSSGMTPPHVNDIGYERFSALMDAAAREGITICYENLRKLSNLAFAFEEFPAARFCWDCGHEFCFTPGRHYMPLFGDKLSALHLHDNHCVQNRDEHLIPYDGTIDYDYVARQISASGFQGTLMLEVIRQQTDFYAADTPETYYARAGAAARRLRAAVAAAEEEKE